MNLKSIYSIIFILGGIFFEANAQVKSYNDLSEYKSSNEFIMSIGWLQPIGVGNNFANKGFSLGRGVDAQILLRKDWAENFVFGLRFQNINAAIKRKDLVGNYDNSYINSFGFVVGYTIDLPLNKLTIEPRFTLANTNYRNRARFTSDSNSSEFVSISGRFRDTATSYIISGTINYSFNDFLSLYFQPEFRWDNMRINTADELSSFFWNAYYINFSLGLSFRL